ncbi:MAG: hypothetical protein ACJAV5_000923 [Vicingaceae bacterium]|jgi:hypothetical protein
MIHPNTELKMISPEMGIGVFATKFIPKGTITWAQDELDIVLSPQAVRKLSNEYQATIEKYAFRNRDGESVLCWDNSRFVNHSFNSNCLTTPYNFEIAIRDIQIGEELTDDYGYLNISEPFEAFNEESERKVVYPDDLLRYHPVWDAQIADAMQMINQVPQELYGLIPKKWMNRIELILKGEGALDSILTCYYHSEV